MRLIAQPANNLIKDVVMPAPNAAALGKYGDIPVSYYTGVPNISIPIYTAQSNSLSMPISLNYHASGVKVAETASWVGAGWSLSAGGMITRTVQGIPDERDNGYYMNGNNINLFAKTIQDAALGLTDSEPDIFNFNVAGYNGKFYFDKDQKPQFIPKQDFNVSVTKSNLDFLSFTLTAADGTRFIFGQIGITNAYETTNVFTSMPYSVSSDAYISSWYLLKVETVDKTSSINFSYENENYSYKNKSSCRKVIQFCTDINGGVTSSEKNSCSTASSNDFVVTNVTGKRLKTIETPTEIITFNALTGRLDLDNGIASVGGATSKNRLDNIVITSGTKTVTWNLNYDYFVDNITNTTLTSADRRLKLLSIQESSDAGSNPPHTFEYNGNFIVNRHSKAIDHWGFYNGKITNDALEFNFPETTVSGFTKGSALRESDEASMKMGVLTKITYPTGGFSQFDFEANRVSVGSNVIAEPLSFESCTQLPLPGSPPSTLLCGTHKNAVNFSFTSQQLQNIIKFTLSLDASNLDESATACSGLSEVAIKVYTAQNGTLLGQQSYNVNRAHFTTRSFTYPITNLCMNFEANTNYYFELTSKNGNANFTMTVTTPSTVDRIVGGLRVKSVTTNDNVTSNNIIRTYQYLEPNLNVSSGVLTQEPTYGYHVSSIVQGSGFAITEIVTFESQSVVPLGSFDGYHIGYHHVKELLNGIGSKSYYYYYTLPESLTDAFPAPPTVFSKESGQKVAEFTYNSSSSIPIASKEFVSTPANYTFNTGIIFKAVAIPRICTGPTVPTNPMSGWTVYNIRTDAFRLEKTVDIIDDVKTTTDYTYSSDANQPLFPITTTITNSNGKITTVTNKYITHPDYINSATSSVSMLAKRMKNLNIIANPIEVTTKIGTLQINGSKTNFSCFSSTTGLPTTDTVNNYPYPYKAYSINKDGTLKLNITVEAYDKGLPKQMLSASSSTPQIFAWDIYKRLIGKNYGSLNWVFDYESTSNLVSQITDENGLIKKFEYDDFMRLKTTQDRVNPNDANDIQATAQYIYHYKGQTATNSQDINQNFVQTITSFKGVTTPLSTKQYMDGLGRPLEVVKENYTPNNQHQKNYVSYDALGRQNKAYLPFESANLGFEAAANLPATYLPKNYVETEYEKSPLSRPIKQTNVDGTTVLSSYGTNTASEVRLFSVPTEGSVSSNSYYPASFLYKTTMTDENNKPTCVFKDKLGRVVLTRKLLNNKRVDTYNVYDDYGQLTAVLPPGSVDSASGNVIYSLAFLYKYDNQNRLIEKKVPGAEAQKFFYDKRDLLTLTQDGNMRTENKYLATQYDNLGRVVKTGWKFDTTGLWSGAITIADDDYKLTQIEYYPNKSWVKHQGAKVLKPIGTTTLREFVWSYIERREGYTYTGNPIWTGKQHLLAETYNYYTGTDNNDRPIDDNDYAGVDWSVNAYDGAQKPTATYRNLFSNGNQTVRTYSTFQYDNGQRLTNIGLNYGLQGTIPSYSGFAANVSNMNYNYKDQLIEKNIAFNGSTALQSIDYTYNQRGWLTSINNVNVYSPGGIGILTPTSIGDGVIQNLMIAPLVRQAMLDLAAPYKSNTPSGGRGLELPPINDNNVDLFSEKIDYNSPDSRTGAPSQLNGNISAVTWQVAGRDKQAYGFKYDDLDRLTDATYFDLTDVNTNGQWNSTYSTDNKFWEKATYDVRGNITALKRNGYKWGAWTTNGYTAANYSLIDDLAYTYNSQNQVTYIHDAAPNPSLPPNVFGGNTKGFVENNQVNMMGGDHYEYDNNGNMKADKHKGMTIEYNYLNLPQVITFSGNRTITFVYDASGAKLQKITNDNGAKITYNYVNGVEYKDDVLQRLPHTEGAVVRNEFGAYDQEYVLRDHLGNVRVMFKDGTNKGDAYFGDYWDYIDPNAGNIGYNDGVITQDDIKTINNYYPFGMDMEGNWNGSFDIANNKYKYNEKEWNNDFGLGLYDYGARFYDPAIGRWNAIDPLGEKFYRWSPYNYCMNNPVRFIDPDGAIVTDPEGHIVTTYVGKKEGSSGSFKTLNSDGSTTYTTINMTADIVNIYANDGTPIQALIITGSKIVKEVTYNTDGERVKTQSASNDCATNCHGTSLTDGKLWIDNDQAVKLLEHDYTNVENREDSNVSAALILDGSNPTALHTIKRETDGKYTADDGCKTTKTGLDYNQAMGAYTGGGIFPRNYQSKGNKAMATTLGKVNEKGVRTITDKKEIEQFVQSLNK